MPTLSPLYADADLEMAMGGGNGASHLLEISNCYATTDAAYTSFLARVRSAAQQQVFRIMGVAFDPLDSTVTGSDAAATLCLSVAIYYAWFYGTGGQAIPDAVTAEKNSALEQLAMIRDGQSGMGTADEPGNKTGTRTVSIAGNRCAVIRRNMGGFC